MIYHANTLQTQTPLNPSVWALSTKGCRSSECPIDTPCACFSEMVWFIGRTSPKCYSVRAAGESTTHLCHFLTPPAVFHASDVQSAWRVTAWHHVCHMDSPWTTGEETPRMTRLLWKQEATWTLHVGHMVPACLLLRFNSTRKPQRTESSRTSQIEAFFFYAGTEWAHSLWDNKLLVSSRFSPHLPPECTHAYIR